VVGHFAFSSCSPHSIAAILGNFTATAWAPWNCFLLNLFPGHLFVPVYFVRFVWGVCLFLLGFWRFWGLFAVPCVDSRSGSGCLFCVCRFFFYMCLRPLPRYRHSHSSPFRLSFPPGFFFCGDAEAVFTFIVTNPFSSLYFFFFFDRKGFRSPPVFFQLRDLPFSSALLCQSSPL